MINTEIQISISERSSGWAINKGGGGYCRLYSSAKTGALSMAHKCIRSAAPKCCLWSRVAYRSFLDAKHL